MKFIIAVKLISTMCRTSKNIANFIENNTCNSNGIDTTTKNAMFDLLWPILTTISATDVSQSSEAFLKANIFTDLTGGLSSDKLRGPVQHNHLQSPHDLVNLQFIPPFLLWKIVPVSMFRNDKKKN